MQVGKDVTPISRTQDCLSQDMAPGVNIMKDQESDSGFCDTKFIDVRCVVTNNGRGDMFQIGRVVVVVFEVFLEACQNHYATRQSWLIPSVLRFECVGQGWQHYNDIQSSLPSKSIQIHPILSKPGTLTDEDEGTNPCIRERWQSTLVVLSYQKLHRCQVSHDHRLEWLYIETM